MKRRTGGGYFMWILVTAIQLSAFTIPVNNSGKPAYHFPYQQAGLNERQAAAHLLSRFTYGAMPGQVDQVVSMGLEVWFEQQLKANFSDTKLLQRLEEYPGLKLSNSAIVTTYLKNAQVLRMAIADGAINKDSVNKGDKKLYRSKLDDYMARKGIQPERELVRQFVSQKILRATYSENQLQEVMTELWFNHFNVSFTKNICGQFIPNYEREVIRPNALGKFEHLVMATAKSPAMLLYLDNFSSVGAEDAQVARKPDKNGKVKKMKGLNENYAREVMELHTLGVDGGYTQQDVTEAARILTGWTVYPMGSEGYGNGYKKLLEKVGEDKLKARGFVHEGDFLFTPNRHDRGTKIVLGKHFNADGGYSDGIRLLKMISEHPSTEKFISKKIAIRFVSDEPPVSLTEKMAKTFHDKNGDIKQVLVTMVSSPEFWSASALREKTKSPFELTISAIRSLGAEVKQPYQLFDWIKRMGQPLYSYETPAGFPDKGQYWINTGSLLSRMNFGLALADGRIRGLSFDLLALNNHHEPESAEAALFVYGKLIMPERNTDETVKRLTPLLNDPDLQQKIEKVAGTHAHNMNKGNATDSLADEKKDQPDNSQEQNKYRLSQVLGILIGSPEFQRR